MIHRRFSAAVLVLFSVTVVLFGQSAPSSESLNKGGQPGLNYVIKPLDVLRFSVYQESDLNQEVRVSAEGNIALPLIGEVKVAGMTVDNARKMITQRYDKDYLVNPQITLLVLSYQERRVYVHGQVNNPGPVIIPPEEAMTLAQAISAARGLTRLAEASSIKIRRETADGGNKVFEVNFKDILRDPEAKDILVKDGDNIFVDERYF